MTRVKSITGVGITTSVDMEAADLGILRWDEMRQCTIAAFGDNFSRENFQGTWYSPSLVCYDEQFNVLGVPVSGGKIASNTGRKQLWDYPHNNPAFTTVLPTDFIKIGEWWYIHVMVTKGLANEQWTEFQRSRDLVTWEHTGIKLDVKRNNGCFVMLTFEQFGSYVYILSTGGLARNKPIIMHRCPVERFPDPAAYEPWGWSADGGWKWGKPATPVMNGKWGEINFRELQGNLVFTGFDAEAYRIIARVVASPTDNWYTAPSTQVAGGAISLGMEGRDRLWRLYGGYLDKQHSVLNKPGGMKWIASQWGTDNRLYQCVLFDGTLQAAVIKSPPAAPAPQPIPVPVPVPASTPPKETPVATEAQVGAEFQAEHAIPLQYNETGPKLTLRGAIASILWQATKKLTRDKAVPINVADNELGHVLSLRCEMRDARAEVASLRKALTDAKVIK